MLGAVLAMGCAGKGNGREGDAGEAGHVHVEAAVAVQLDHGQRWPANVETTNGISAMRSLVDTYDTATGDGAMLKKELLAEFNGIFAKCTMTGEAHEQLHAYLTPIHGALEHMGASPTGNEIVWLQRYLATYGDYFQ